MRFIKPGIFFLILFSSALLFSQVGQPKFLSIGQPNLNERGAAIYVKPDGSYYVGGLKSDSALVMYMSSTDAIIWAKTFKFTAYACYVNYLTMTSDGYLLGAGTSYSGVNYGCYFKMNALTGGLIWHNSFNGNNLYVTRIIEKSVTEYICIGGEYPTVPASVGVDAKNVTVSAATGNILSQSQCMGYQPFNWLDDLEGATDLSNGFFYSSGRTYLQNLPAKMRSHLFKYDPLGNIVWSEYLHMPATGTSRMYTRDLIMYGQSHLLLLYLADDICSGACSDYYPGVMLIDTAGTVIWDKIYNIPASNSEYIEKINVMGNSIYVSGYTNINSGNNNIFILKTDLGGNVQACNQYGSPILNEKPFINNLSTAGDCKNGLFYFVYAAENTSGFSDLNILKVDSTLNLPCYPGTPLSTTAITVTPYQTSYTIQYNASTFNTSANSIASASLANPCPTSYTRLVDTFYVAGPDTVINATAANATSYFWNTGAATSTLLVAGQQADSVLISIGCCPSVNHVYRLYFCNYTVSVAGAASICKGQTNTLTASGAAGYTWYPGGSTSNSLIVSPNITTTYSIVTTNTAGCSLTTTVSQVVVPVPTLVVSPATQAFCAGSLVTLTVSGATAYTWQPGNFTGANYSLTPSVSTAYTLTGATLGCVGQAVYNLTVIPSPTLVVSGSPTLICSGQSASLSATGANVYVWNPGNISSATATVFPATTTNYTITGSNSICSSTVSVLITVVPKPNLTIVPGVLKMCHGATLAVTASGAQTYSWLPASVVSSATGASVSLASDSSKVITLAGANSLGTLVCLDSKTYPLSVLPYVIPVISDSVSMCKGDTALLRASGGSTFSWLPGNRIVHAGTNSVMISPDVSTIYTVTVSESSHCSKTATVMVTVNQRPYVFAGNDTTFNRQDVIMINALSNGTVKWIGPDIKCADCVSTQVFIKYPQQGACYMAEASNKFGCKAEDDICIDVTDDCAIYIPNTFTPNSDGTNEIFYVYGFGVSEYWIEVYDRWGAQIFSATDGQNGWNGFYKGKLCQQDVYVYRIGYKLVNKEYIKTGFVNLIR
jgi:gliding motility-associated-like protein